MYENTTFANVYVVTTNYFSLLFDFSVAHTGHNVDCDMLGIGWGVYHSPGHAYPSIDETGSLQPIENAGYSLSKAFKSLTNKSFEITSYM